MRPTLRDIIGYLQDLAPESFAEEWDNVGLQVGDPAISVSRALVAVDVTQDVLAVALDWQANLIIVHHPLLFRPPRRLDLSTPPGRMLKALISSGIAVYALHTNLDVAPEGISRALADALGLRDIRVLSPSPGARLYKLAVFTPEEALDKVRNAMAEAGAGLIGSYSHCSFQTEGIGTFLPLEGASPYVGQVGSLNYEREFRLEMLLPSSRIGPVVAAMLRAHPYEEVAYDLYPMENRDSTTGLGCIGVLPRSISLERFARQVGKSLSSRFLRVQGLPKNVRTVAVCGGSGRSLLDRAASSGADVFVTGDMGHHDWLYASQLELAVIDAGHYETEYPGMRHLSERLQTHFQGAAEFRPVQGASTPISSPLA